MRLDTEFIRLPLQFDPARLAEEVAAFSEQDWQPHPEGHRGNAALPLLAVHGDPLDNGTKGRMQPTPQLAQCPYLRQVLAALDAPIGRTRLMRIDGNAEATMHVDVNYYWQQRMRVHIPIVSDPAVRFLCGDKSLHMAPGEAWIFDTWRLHNVVNPCPSRRIHLVIDTVGSGSLSELLAEGLRPFDPALRPVAKARFIPFQADADPVFRQEASNYPIVMAPPEQQQLFDNINQAMPQSEAADALRAEVLRFLEHWDALWRRHHSSAAGWREYGELIERSSQRLGRFSGSVELVNKVDAVFAVQQILLVPALNTDLAPRGNPVVGEGRARFDRPIFIISSPRSGSSLLFETLAQAPGLFSIGGESHAQIEGIESLHPAAGGWQSNRLTAADATPDVADDLAARFAAAAKNRHGQALAPGRFRFIEKTPKNSLRIPFLRAVFPDALFIYLYRDERATISSMLEAWRSGRFVTYPELPDWSGQPWSMALVPGWRELGSKPLAETVVSQWQALTEIVLNDLEKLPSDSWCVASYDRLIANPQEEILRLCKFVGIKWDVKLTLPLPDSRHTLTPPDPEKWLANSALLEPFLPIAAETAARARAIFAHQPLRRAAPPAGPQAQPPADDPNAFRSIHTSNLSPLLAGLQASLLVSTYQSGRVIMLRADGPLLNTHLRYFANPMGMAFDGQRLALGTVKEIWDYRNMPSAAARLHPDKHDACFMPRNMHVTGDIRVHELAFDGEGELWFVNTRFSALCTLDREHSFVPRWRPSFVSALAAEDRCHLNGLCMLDGRPRFVTALGQTDSLDGWRANKASGGIVMDVPSGEIVASGLSMPHSPRWHDGRLWVLESAKGTVATIDPASGRCETLAQLPGFTRGLAFSGHHAFVGLSQVRESVFDGISLGQRLRPEERCCGVWVIDIRSGATVGFVKFEGAVQEIFDVQLLPGIVYPDILEPDADLIGASFVLSDEALADVPQQ